MTECIQIRKREENLGVNFFLIQLGAAVGNNNWTNSWWQNNYNDILSKIEVKVDDDVLSVKSTDSLSSSEKVLMKKRKRKIKMVKL